MRNRRNRIADWIGFLGVALMIVIATLATYLEWVGTLDPALLPYFLAFAAYCLAHVLAEFIRGGRNASRRAKKAV